MRKLIPISLLITVAIAGFASVRLRAPEPSFPPHSIVYRVTFYDEDGTVAGSETLLRQVLSDGTWRHTQLRTDGSVLHTKGKIKHLVTSNTPEGNWPEHLGFMYFEEKNSSTETWISPALQDNLKFTALSSKGLKQSTLEAIDITIP